MPTASKRFQKVEKSGKFILIEGMFLYPNQLWSQLIT